MCGFCYCEQQKNTDQFTWLMITVQSQDEEDSMVCSLYINSERVVNKFSLSCPQLQFFMLEFSWNKYMTGTFSYDNVR